MASGCVGATALLRRALWGDAEKERERKKLLSHSQNRFAEMGTALAQAS